MPKQSLDLNSKFLVRSRAEEWHIDPHRVGMLGFSAGDEVVALVACDSGEGDPNAADPVDRLAGLHWLPEQENPGKK